LSLARLFPEASSSRHRGDSFTGSESHQRVTPFQTIEETWRSWVRLASTHSTACWRLKPELDLFLFRQATGDHEMGLPDVIPQGGI
jgi:hypothetical protein